MSSVLPRKRARQPDVASPSAGPPEQQLAASHESALRLWRTLQDALRNLMPPDDANVDLPFRQFRICVALYRRRGPATMTELSREAGMSLSALTQIANRLARAGMVEREFRGADRRVRYLKLSSAGEAMMRQRENARVGLLEECLARLSADESKQIQSALELLAGASTKTVRRTPERQAGESS